MIQWGKPIEREENQMDEKRIGERIAKLRTAANLTQAALAEKLGVSDKTVSKWEVGGGYPDITFFPLLADTFHVSCDYLLRGTPRMAQKVVAEYPFGSNRGKRSIDNLNDYLDQGWRVKESALSVSDQNECIMLVIEKEVYDE